MAGFNSGFLVLDPFGVTTASGDNNDVPIEGSLVYVTVSNNNDAITGLSSGLNAGALIFVVNVGPTNNLVIKNNSGSSSAGNKIFTSTGSDVTVPPFQTACMGYDTIGSAWHVIKFA